MSFSKRSPKPNGLQLWRAHVSHKSGEKALNDRIQENVNEAVSCIENPVIDSTNKDVKVKTNEFP